MAEAWADPAAAPDHQVRALRNRPRECPQVIPLDERCVAWQPLAMMSGDSMAGERNRPSEVELSAWSRVARWVIVAAALPFTIWFFRGFDFAELSATLARASLPLVAAAALANLTLNTAARAQRFRALLPPSPRQARPVGFFELVALVLASQATSNILPFRAGEAVRTLRLRERHGYPLKTLIAAQLIEKPIEVLSLTAFALPAALAVHIAQRVLVTLFALALAGCLALGLMLRIARSGSSAEGGGSGPRRLFPGLGGAAEVLCGPGAWGQSFLWSMASDLIEMALIGVCMAAVGIQISPAAWCVVLIAVNIAIAIPASPGQIGVLEAGAVLVLTGLGVDRSSALAFALIYHAVHLLPTTAFGGLALALLHPSQGRRGHAA
jgi:uncharacterized membrane protein YbhN (UPF0104 family)